MCVPVVYHEGCRVLCALCVVMRVVTVHGGGAGAWRWREW